MKARYLIYARLTPDGEGLCGIQAVCDVTFVMPDGTQIIGTSITSPGIWEVAGYADEEYFDSLAEEEFTTLADMLLALGVKDVWTLIPEEVIWESAYMESATAGNRD